MAKKWQRSVLLGAGLLLAALDAQAGCTSSHVRQDYTMALRGGNLYVSPTAAVGSEIYKQEFSMATQGYISVNCSPAASAYAYEFFSNPLTLSSLDRVYKTSVPGIGIRFKSTVHNLTFPSGPSGDRVNKNSWGLNSSTDKILVSLIKTENTVGQGVIEGGSLPVSQWSFVTIPIWRLTLSGSLTINTATCDIAVPSNTVNMGSHPSTQLASSATAWKDASIVLNNCGQFSGRTSPTINPSYYGNTDTYSNTALVDNTMTITLSPNDGIASAVNGIMNIATSGAGNTPAAKGVGIQLSSGQSESGKINLNSPLKITLPRDGTPVITVPLFARYIKTGGTIGGGKANGKLTWTVEYQ